MTSDDEKLKYLFSKEVNKLFTKKSLDVAYQIRRFLDNTNKPPEIFTENYGCFYEKNNPDESDEPAPMMISDFELLMFSYYAILNCLIDRFPYTDELCLGKIIGIINYDEILSKTAINREINSEKYGHQQLVSNWNYEDILPIVDQYWSNCSSPSQQLIAVIFSYLLNLVLNKTNLEEIFRLLTFPVNIEIDTLDVIVKTITIELYTKLYAVEELKRINLPKELISLVSGYLLLS